MRGSTFLRNTQPRSRGAFFAARLLLPPMVHSPPPRPIGSRCECAVYLAPDSWRGFSQPPRVFPEGGVLVLRDLAGPIECRGLRATVERAFLSAKKAPPKRGFSFVMIRRVGSPAEPYFETNSHALSSRYPTHSRPRPKIEGRPATPEPSASGGRHTDTPN